MVLRRKSYIDSIDRQLILLLGLVENFGKSDDDIVNILDKSNHYLKSPIKEIIYDFVMDMRLNGNWQTALSKIEKRVNHTKLKEVFWYFKICQEHESNYCDVVKDLKISVNEHIKSKNTQNAIIASARIDVLALLMSGYFVIKMLNGFLTDSVFMILTNSFVGIAIICYCVLSIMLALYLVFF